MADLIPSYLLKIDRAVEHLKEFKAIVTPYIDSHPYTVTHGREGRSEVHRLHFTSQIEPRARMIAADFVYNVRSGLDHFAAALNPPKMRTHISFPILWEGVWEPGVPSDNEERTKARERWNTSTREMQPGAVAILKGFQAAEGGLDDAGLIHHLVALNRLSNRDRHSQIPLMPVGLSGSVALWQLPDGQKQGGREKFGDWGMIEDDAEVGVPDGAMNVEINGTPKIAIRITAPNGNVEVPAYFDNLFDYVRNYVFTPLFPFLYVPVAKN